ncbi:MAG: diacylglycerol kinase family protein [Myxococcaceae bacterium]|nr:diacylglycerol kinase family protein [Myxococcaceae bacterium]
MSVGERPPLFQATRPNTFWASVSYAWAGLVHTVVHQRNMRMHMLAAMMVGFVGTGIPLGLAEKVTMIFCVLLVFFAEVLNSALEHLVDLAVQQFDEKARVTKNAAAAGVLVLALGTVVIFAAVLVHNVDTIASHGVQIQRQVVLGVPFIICAGGLMHESPKPIAVDWLFGVVGFLLWVASLPFSESAVFSAMNFGLWVVTVAAARERRLTRVTA